MPRDLSLSLGTAHLNTEWIVPLHCALLPAFRDDALLSNPPLLEKRLAVDHHRRNAADIAVRAVKLAA